MSGPSVELEIGADPIVDAVHRVRQVLLEEFGGNVDALMDEANRRLLSGEFGEFKVVTRSPRTARASEDRFPKNP